MTEETIDDVKQAYALLFKENGKLREERDALLDKVRDFGGRMTDEQSSTLAELDDAIAASTPKVLTEADLAGLPRAVSSEVAMALTVDLQLISGFVFDPRPKSAIHRASDIIEKLVSERDALAGRVAELEAERDRALRNRDMWKGQCERQAETLSMYHAKSTGLERDGLRYRHMRDLRIEQTGMPGQPCIAMPNGMQSGYYLTEETADHAVDTSIAAQQKEPT